MDNKDAVAVLEHELERFRRESYADLVARITASQWSVVGQAVPAPFTKLRSKSSGTHIAAATCA